MCGHLPDGNLTISEDEIILQNMDKCSLCEICMDVCPKEVITVKEE